MQVITAHHITEYACSPLAARIFYITLDISDLYFTLFEIATA